MMHETNYAYVDDINIWMYFAKWREDAC